MDSHFMEEVQQRLVKVDDEAPIGRILHDERVLQPLRDFGAHQVEPLQVLVFDKLQGG